MHYNIILLYYSLFKFIYIYIYIYIYLYIHFREGSGSSTPEDTIGAQQESVPVMSTATKQVTVAVEEVRVSEVAQVGEEPPLGTERRKIGCVFVGLTKASSSNQSTCSKKIIIHN